MVWITVAMIVVYVGAGLAIGVRASHRTKRTGSSYFLADRSVGWVHLSLTLFATWMSTFAFIGSPGYYFKTGVNWFLPHAFLVVASPMLAWFLGRRIWLLGRRHGYVTPGDLLAHRCSSKPVRVITAGVCLLALIPYSLIQLIGIGKVVSVSTQGAIPFEAVVLVAGLTVAVYTLAGGVRAIIGTDVMQAVVFGIIMFAGAIVAIGAAGGFADGFQRSVMENPEAFRFAPDKVGSRITLMVVWSFGHVLLPHMWQRYYMADSAKTLVRGITAGSVLALFVIVVPSLLLGTLGIGVYGVSDMVRDSDNYIPTLFMDFARPLVPILMLGTFAAGMSTIDSQLLSAASIVVRDLAAPLRRNRLSASQEASIGRWTVVSLLFLITALAFPPLGRAAASSC